VTALRRTSLLPLIVVLGACSGIEIPGASSAGAATWAHDPGTADDIGPDTTSFTAWVTETGCASGQSSADRIVGPDIDVTPDTVVVTFRVLAPPGAAQECPGNPPTRVVVDFPEPLGDRTLLDGGREPPAEPPICANPESCE
jgi:hypothetical protein